MPLIPPMAISSPLLLTIDKNLKEYLNTREAVDGYTISNIQWSDRVGETKVTISKDGQFATLTFNEALLSQGIQNPVPQPQPAIAGHPAGAGARPNIPRRCSDQCRCRRSQPRLRILAG